MSIKSLKFHKHAFALVCEGFDEDAFKADWISDYQIWYGESWPDAEPTTKDAEAAFYATFPVMKPIQ